MPNMMGKVFNALSKGAEVKQIRDVGYLVIDRGQKRIRRSKEEMERDLKKENK